MMEYYVLFNAISGKYEGIINSSLFAYQIAQKITDRYNPINNDYIIMLIENDFIERNIQRIKLDI